MVYKVVITVMKSNFSVFVEYTEVYYLLIVFSEVTYKDEN